VKKTIFEEQYQVVVIDRELLLIPRNCDP